MLLSIILWGACTKAPLPAPPPVAPQGTRSPYDDLSLQLAPSGVVTGEATFQADGAAMNQVNPGNWNVVFGNLAADPSWRLCEYDNAIVAFEREHGAVDRDGFVGHTRVLFRFTAWDRELPWAGGAPIARVPADHATITAPVFGDPARVAIAYEGLDLTLEVLDTGDFERARGALAAASAMTTELLGERAPPPPGAEGLAVTRTNRGIDIRGWIDPGQPGWTWLRLVRNDGTVLHEDAVAIATREALGFGQPSYLQAEVPLPPGPGFKGRAEAWIRPAMGDDVKVGEWAVTVPRRRASPR